MTLTASFAGAVADGTGAALVFLMQVALLALLAFIGHLIGSNGCIRGAWLVSMFLAVVIALAAAATLGRESGPVPEGMGGDEPEIVFVPSSHERLRHSAFIFVCALAAIGGASHYSARHAESVRAAANVQWQQERAQAKHAAQHEILQQPPVEASIAHHAEVLARIERAEKAAAHPSQAHPPHNFSRN